MKIRFWGVRGSIPTPGESTVRYGGNTPCTELRLDNGELIILDAGTGIRNLGDELQRKGERVKGYLLITHPHWDHIQGFPFFKPAFQEGNELVLIGTERPEKKLEEIISEQMKRIYFPIQLDELKAKITFKPIGEETNIGVYGAVVSSLFVNHPGFTVGYRIEYKDKVVVYISDNEPFDIEATKIYNNFEEAVRKKFENGSADPNKRIYDFCRDADLLIHDSTYTPEESENHKGWGHSDYRFSLKIAAEAKVRKLCLFHHHPDHSDDQIDEILRRCQSEARLNNYNLECCAAKEKAEIVV